MTCLDLQPAQNLRKLGGRLSVQPNPNGLKSIGVFHVPDSVTPSPIATPPRSLETPPKTAPGRDLKQGATLPPPIAATPPQPNLNDLKTPKTFSRIFLTFLEKG